MIQGKCLPCKTAYRWVGELKKERTACPKCGRPLRQTTYLQSKYRWEDLERPPFGKGECPHLRLEYLGPQETSEGQPSLELFNCRVCGTAVAKKVGES